MSEEVLMRLGSIDQKVTDLREALPKAEARSVDFDRRLERLERQFSIRHEQNTDRLTVLEAALTSFGDKLTKALAAFEARLTAVEEPVTGIETRKTHRRAWIKRGIQIVGSIGAAALLLVEPATKVAVEFWSRRYFDR